MMKPLAIRRAAIGLGLMLFVEGGLTSDRSAQGSEATPPPAPVPAPAATPSASPGLSQGAAGVQLAAATQSKRRARRKTRPRKRRVRRAAPLRLPAVTPYGIPRLHLKAAYVVDATNNRVLFQKNAARVLPIASLTKLITAMVFLGTNPDWDRVIEIVPEDVLNSSKTRIRSREEITVRDLFHAALMSSDNCATKALVRTSGVPFPEFMRRMNTMADSLGLSGTRFVEPTGLSERNVSTAQDLARILLAATRHPEIAAASQKTEYQFVSNKKLHHLVNTNRLLRSQWTITGGKTGFIRESGYCLVTNVKAPTGIHVTAVLLGAPSNALRFAEARRILDWTFRFGLKHLETVPEAP